MRSRLSKPRKTVARKSQDYAVRDDLAGLPVEDAEIDAVEAFLMAEIRDLLAKSWEPAQSHADIGDIPQSRRRRP